MDKKEKQAMYKVLLFVSPFFLATIMGYALPKYEDLRYRAYERSMIAYVSSTLKVYQQSYKTEFNKFQTRKNEIILSTEGLNGVTVYFDSADLPEYVRSELVEEELPFLKDEAYRILIHLRPANASKSALWYVDSNGKNEKIWSGPY